MILVAVILAAIAYRILAVIKHEILERAGKAKSTRRPSPMKAIVLSVGSGLLMGSYLPFLANAREGELGMGPYATMVLFAVGVVVSTFILNLFFMNLPVEGEPVEFFDYFKGDIRTHGIGLLAGAIWCFGAIAIFAAGSAPGTVPDSLLLAPHLSFALERASAIVAALIGIFLWREFRGGDGRVKLLLGLMLVLFAGGLALIALSPAPPHKI
jgi:glucose uptake protein